MRYQISYLIKGDAKEYHENLSNVLARFYKLRPVTGLIDPHITLKAPFETEDISPVEKTIELFLEEATPEPITLGGFGSIDDRLVYMGAEAPESTHALIKRLQDELRTIPWIEFRDYEVPATLNATLCFPRTPETVSEIESKLTLRGGKRFDALFDNVAILKRGPRRWEILREFAIGKPESEKVSFMTRAAQMFE